MGQPDDRVAVLGLGGAGGNIVARLAADSRSERLGLGVADTDSEALERLVNVVQIPLGTEWTGRSGCGGDRDLGERAASESAGELREFLGGARLALIVAGLGGGTGSGAIDVVARLVREADTAAFFITTLPLVSEGNWRRQHAEDALVPLRELADVVVVVPNDLLFTSLPPDSPADQAFAVVDKALADGIDGLSRIASARSLLPVDFADFRSLLKGRPATCALGVGRASGEGRCRAALDAFVSCPLVGGREALSAAHAAAVTLVGGPDLAVGEMQDALGDCQELFSTNARVVFGTYTDPSVEGEVQITGLLCSYAEPPGTSKPQGKATAVAAGRKRRSHQHAQDSRQGELPLTELALGVFSGGPPTIVGGENLDVPTFQRRGVDLDAGE